MLDQQKFREHLEWAEGRVRFPYEDSVGKISIGVGRNLDDKGLSNQEIDFLLANDMADAVQDASTFSYFYRLCDTRQLVIADLCFNLGLAKFRKFVKTHAALERGDFEGAADELVDSRWYAQVGRRAKKLVRAMRTGEWRED